MVQSWEGGEKKKSVSRSMPNGEIFFLGFNALAATGPGSKRETNGDCLWNKQGEGEV